MKYSTLHSAEVQGTGTRNAARLWQGASNISDVSILTERERKDRFEHSAKNQTAVFQSRTFLLQNVETREGIKLT